MPLFLFAVFSAVSALAAATAAAICADQRRRIEFVHGKCHAAEEAARVVILILYAFLIGDAVFRHIDKILRGALDPHDREEAERNVEIVLAVLRQRAAHAAADILGDAVAGADAAGREVAAGRLHHARAENDRLCNLNGCNRHIGREAG